MITGGILGLDTGTTTGWAIGPLSAPRRGMKQLECGTFTAGWEGCTEIQACGSFGKWLAKLLAERQPIAVAIEAPELFRHDKLPNITRLHGIVGVARETCYRHGLKNSFYEYRFRTIKRHASGDEYASKEVMMEAGRKRQWKFPDDNACDGLWIRDLLDAELTQRAEAAARAVA